jgi:hypothetical protein
MAPFTPLELHLNGSKSRLLQCHVSFISLLYIDEQNALLKDWKSTRPPFVTDKIKY